jgi:hypothetical protein
MLCYTPVDNILRRFAFRSCVYVCYLCMGCRRPQPLPILCRPLHAFGLDWLRCLLVWVKLNGVNLSLIRLFHLNEDGIDVFE